MIETHHTEQAPPFAEAIAASAQVDANRIEPLRTFEQELPVPLTDAELLEEGDTLAQLHSELDELDSQVEQVKATFKADLDILKSRVDDHLRRCKATAKIIRDKEQSKLVGCREDKVFATGSVLVTRLDTGVVVSERPMDVSERQADLFPPAEGSMPPESFSGLDSDDEPHVITDPASVLPPEAATNGRGRKRGRRS